MIQISVGELLDKITILQIKSKKSDNPFIHKELKDLSQVAKNSGVYLENYICDLKDINLKLWEIEDELRNMEKKKLFDENFIELARNVYKYNDIRANIKKKINETTHSIYQEVKLYK